MLVVDGSYNGLTDIPLDAAQGKDVIDLIRLGGVSVIHQSVVIDYRPTTFAAALKQILDHDTLIDLEPERLRLVLTPADAAACAEDGKLGLVYTFQGADPIEENVDNLIVLYRMGLRVLQITYNTRNRLGSGAYEPHDDGLTRFGQIVVRACNQLGIIIDLSHVGQRTALDTVAHSSAPVVVSHSNASAICPHTRNISDELIKAVGERDGLIGLTPHSVFVQPKGETGRPDLDHFIDHIHHAANLIGPDHVSIGTDRFVQDNLYARLTRKREDVLFGDFWGGFDATQKHVQGFDQYDHWRGLFDRLEQRGFSSSEIAGIAGGNWLRTYQTAWR